MVAEPPTTRRWWAPIGIGALLCFGCCLTPILLAAGMLGSGTFLVGLSWLEPFGLALVGLGVTGLVWSRTRARRPDCGSAESRSIGGELGLRVHDVKPEKFFGADVETAACRST